MTAPPEKEAAPVASEGRIEKLNFEEKLDENRTSVKHIDEIMPSVLDGIFVRQHRRVAGSAALFERKGVLVGRRSA